MKDKIIPIDILAHADFAGCLKQNKRNPGLAAYSALIDDIKDLNPKGTLLLDSGDQYCVNYWGGKPVVEALELIGTDALTLGNHEFDWGKKVLEENVGYAKYPILCANILDKATHTFVKGVKPYVILEKAKVKIGILGLTTEYTPYMVIKGAFDEHYVVSAIDAANKYLPKMKEEGAEIIIVLAHFPFYIADDYSISGELFDVLSNIPSVDVFIGGHISGDYARLVGDTVVLKAGFGGKSLAHSRLWFDTVERKVVNSENEVLLTDRNRPGKKEVRDYVEKIVSPYDAYFNEVLGYNEEKWTMQYAVESKLGNFLADVLCYGGQAEISYLNTTSSGGTLYPGEISIEDITSIYGFNDEILTTKMSGAKIYELVEHIDVPERFGNNATIAFSGMVVHLDHTQKSPHKLQAITHYDGSPLDKKRIYTVASSEYMGKGGNDTLAVVGGLKWQSTGLKYYDVAFAYLKEHKQLLNYQGQRLFENGSPEGDNSPDISE